MVGSLLGARRRRLTVHSRQPPWLRPVRPCILVSHTCTATAAAALDDRGSRRGAERSAKPPPAHLHIHDGRLREPNACEFSVRLGGRPARGGARRTTQLAGNATILMRDVVVENVTAVGWPSLKEPFALPQGLAPLTTAAWTGRSPRQSLCVGLRSSAKTGSLESR